MGMHIVFPILGTHEQCRFTIQLTHIKDGLTGRYLFRYVCDTCGTAVGSVAQPEFLDKLLLPPAALHDALAEHANTHGSKEIQPGPLTLDGSLNPG